MGHKCSDRDDFNKNHQRKPVQIIKFKRKNGLKKSMKPTSRLNGIKENSKDILEENVEMGMSCSTIIDDKQDKARNNIEDWWRPVSEKVPVIVEVFQEGFINNWRDPLGRAIASSSNRFLELYQF